MHGTEAIAWNTYEEGSHILLHNLFKSCPHIQYWESFMIRGVDHVLSYFHEEIKRRRPKQRSSLKIKFWRWDRKKGVVERGRITPYTTKPNCYMDEIYLVDCGWDLADCGWDLAYCGWMRSSRMWMRSSRLVEASDSQCKSRSSPGLDSCMLRYSRIWEATDEAVLNYINLKNNKKHFLNY